LLLLHLLGLLVDFTLGHLPTRLALLLLLLFALLL